MATNEKFIPTKITRGTSTIEVSRDRAAKGMGWNIYQSDGKTDRFLAHRPNKDKALKFALDCCEPTVRATFLVTPNIDGPCPPSSTSSSAAS